MSADVHQKIQLSDVLGRLRQDLPPEGLTLHALLERVGQQGMLLFAIILCLPFLLPVSIPGVSTACGILLTLIGVGVFLNRMPWLPHRLLRKRMSGTGLTAALSKGERFFSRVDRLSRPRLLALTHGATLGRFNGAALAFSGFLLVLPLAPIPFSNTLPAAAALLLSLGILQRDGLALLLGYVMIAASVAYFSLLFLGALAAGRGLGSYFSG